MATDTALLHLSSVTTLRLYVWNPPAVSLGWFQECDESVAHYRALGYDVVRRPTGGGAVVHQHELTYSFIASTTHPRFEGLDTTRSYDVIHLPIVEALRTLGVHVHAPVSAPAPSGGPKGPHLCFDRTASVDLIHNGRKIVGSAQRRVAGRLMQHGSIIFKTNALQSDTGSLEEALGEAPPLAKVVDAIERSFQQHFGAASHEELTPSEVELAENFEPNFAVT